MSPVLSSLFLRPICLRSQPEDHSSRATLPHSSSRALKIFFHRTGYRGVPGLVCPHKRELAGLSARSLEASSEYMVQFFPLRFPVLAVLSSQLLVVAREPPSPVARLAQPLVVQLLFSRESQFLRLRMVFCSFRLSWFPSPRLRGHPYLFQSSFLLER